MFVFLTQWGKVKMLNFNFLNNFKYWGEALHVIDVNSGNALDEVVGKFAVIR